MLDSKKSSLAFLTPNLPKTTENFEAEKEKLAAVTAEADRIEAELSKERSTNSNLQKSIAGIRRRHDELCSMMGLLRGETEAVLHRHNILLETPKAAGAVEAVHEETNGAKNAGGWCRLVDEEKEADEDDLEDESEARDSEKDGQNIPNGDAMQE